MIILKYNIFVCKWLKKTSKYMKNSNFKLIKANTELKPDYAGVSMVLNYSLRAKWTNFNYDKFIINTLLVLEPYQYTESGLRPSSIVVWNCYFVKRGKREKMWQELVNFGRTCYGHFAFERTIFRNQWSERIPAQI